MIRVWTWSSNFTWPPNFVQAFPSDQQMFSAIRFSESLRCNIARNLQLRSLSSQNVTPWFVDQDSAPRQQGPPPPTSMRHLQAPPLPADAPNVLKEVHASLLKSPHLDVKHLLVAPAVVPPVGPDLPDRPAQGKRRRGGTYAGESAYDTTNGLWSWVVFAQVGTLCLFKFTRYSKIILGQRRDRRPRSNRFCRSGGAESGELGSVNASIGPNSDVMPVLFKLLTRTPPMVLPPKSRRQMENGWAMIDTGSYAIHVLSKEAREKYFSSDIVPR